MLSYSSVDLANFLNARSRAETPALEGLADLAGRKITDSDQAIKHSQRLCDRNGLKINQITCAQLAVLFSENGLPSKYSGQHRPVGRPQNMVGGKRVNVYLDLESLKNAEILGDGNVSEGIRLALNNSRSR